MHSSQRDPVLSQQWRCVSRGVATFPTGATFKTIRRGESERNHCPFLPTSAALTLQTQTQETPIFSFNHFGGEIRGKQTEDPPPPPSRLPPQTPRLLHPHSARIAKRRPAFPRFGIAPRPSRVVAGLGGGDGAPWDILSPLSSRGATVIIQTRAPGVRFYMLYSSVRTQIRTHTPTQNASLPTAGFLSSPPNRGRCIAHGSVHLHRQHTQGSVHSLWNHERSHVRTHIPLHRPVGRASSACIRAQRHRDTRRHTETSKPDLPRPTHSASHPALTHATHRRVISIAMEKQTRGLTCTHTYAPRTDACRCIYI